MQAHTVPDLRAMMDFAGRLRDVLPIDILTQDDKEELARRMRVRHFKADEVIYHRGDPSADAHVVHSGLVKVLLGNADGAEALVALHKRGEFFGELALFNDEPRDATVVSILPTTTLQLSRESCEHVLDRNAKARDWMFHHLTETIEALQTKYETMVFLDVPGRLACYLLELKAIGGDLPIRQDELASAIGSTRVTVNKLLADLERRGMLRVSRRKFEILDARALEQVMHH
jgi:CRP/FNR family transcriptional regulator, cyclic AMP receptor protein